MYGNKQKKDCWPPVLTPQRYETTILRNKSSKSRTNMKNVKCVVAMAKRRASLRLYLMESVDYDKGFIEHWTDALMAHRRFMTRSGNRYLENVLVGVTK